MVESIDVALNGTRTKTDLDHPSRSSPIACNVPGVSRGSLPITARLMSLRRVSAQEYYHYYTPGFSVTGSLERQVAVGTYSTFDNGGATIFLRLTLGISLYV